MCMNSRCAIHKQDDLKLAAVILREVSKHGCDAQIGECCSVPVSLTGAREVPGLVNLIALPDNPKPACCDRNRGFTQ